MTVLMALSCLAIYMYCLLMSGCMQLPKMWHWAFLNVLYAVLEHPLSLLSRCTQDADLTMTLPSCSDNTILWIHDEPTIESPTQGCHCDSVKRNSVPGMSQHVLNFGRLEQFFVHKIDIFSALSGTTTVHLMRAPRLWCWPCISQVPAQWQHVALKKGKTVIP